MFNLGLPELGIIAVVALLFIAPKDIPKVAKSIGKFANKARYVRYLFSRQFEDFINEDDEESPTSQHAQKIKMLRKDDGDK